MSCGHGLQVGLTYSALHAFHVSSCALPCMQCPPLRIGSQWQEVLREYEYF